MRMGRASTGAVLQVNPTVPTPGFLAAALHAESPNEGQHHPKHPGGSKSNCQGLDLLLHLPQRSEEHRTQ